MHFSRKVRLREAARLVGVGVGASDRSLMKMKKTSIASFSCFGFQRTVQLLLVLKALPPPVTSSTPSAQANDACQLHSMPRFVFGSDYNDQEIELSWVGKT